MPTVSILSQSSARISWTAGGGDETQYVVQSSTDGVAFSDMATVPVGTTSFTATELSINRQYWFRVASTNDIDALSEYVEAAPAYTFAAVPNAPAVVTSTATTTLDLALDMTTLNGNPTSTETNYIVRDVRSDGTKYLQHDGTWSDTPVQFSYADLGSGAQFSTYGLRANTRHSISVAAVNGNGVVTSYGSPRVSYTLASVPSNVTVSVNTSGVVTIGWDGDASAYEVSGSLRQDWSEGLLARFANVECGTVVQVQVRGRNGDGVVTQKTESVTQPGPTCGGTWAIWKLPVSADSSVSQEDKKPTDGEAEPAALPEKIRVPVVASINNAVPFTVGDSDHVVTVLEASPETITILLRSEPILASLKINVPEMYDTDRDGQLDTVVLFTGMKDGKAQLFFAPYVPSEFGSVSGDKNVEVVTTTFAVTTTLHAEKNNLPSETAVITTSTPTTSTSVGPQPPAQFLTMKLKRGDIHPEVQVLQEKLRTLGYFPVTIKTTKRFGPTTEKALLDYQRAAGLPTTKILDALTRSRLNKQSE
jgi:hypothetical protein